MTMTLCVLLWAHEGRERDLVAYEDRVLALIPEHGGTVLQRARTDVMQVDLVHAPHPAGGSS